MMRNGGDTTHTDLQGFEIPLGFVLMLLFLLVCLFVL